MGTTVLFPSIPTHFPRRETPFTPSKYPGAGSYRIATVARLSKNDDPSRTFTLINTHLDERSEEQRKLGASLILHRCHYETMIHKVPVFVVGDFNRYGIQPWLRSRLLSPNLSEQEGRDSGAYRILTAAEHPKPIPIEFHERFRIPTNKDPNFKMIDLRGATPRARVLGFFRTFTGFNDPMGFKAGGRIDYILGSSGGGW